MEWIIGSESQRKIDTARKVIAQISGTNDFIIAGCNARSGVGNTPYDEDTLRGAKNRAADCQLQFPNADWWVGLESGIVNRYGELFEEAWAVIVAADGKEYLGFSSGLKVPNAITNRMAETNLEHWQVMPQMRAEQGMHDEKDTWGNYTGNMLIREISLEEALRNALVQAFAPKTAFYHL